MKKIALTIGILLVSIGCTTFISFTDYYQNEKIEVPTSLFERYRFEFEGIKRHEGWKIPNPGMSQKKPYEKEEVIDGVKFSVKSYGTPQLPIMEVETYMIEEGKLKILKEECELTGFSFYSIDCKEFACSAEFIPVAFSNGFKTRGGIVKTWIFCDEDGNGTFEMRYDYVYNVVANHLKIPDWVKKRAAESAKPQK